MKDTYEIKLVFGDEKGDLPTLDQFRKSILDPIPENSDGRRYIDFIERFSLFKEIDTWYAETYWNFVRKTVIITPDSFFPVKILREYGTPEGMVFLTCAVGIIIYLLFGIFHLPSIFAILFSFFLLILIVFLSYRHLYYIRYRKQAAQLLNYMNLSVKVIHQSRERDYKNAIEWTIPKLAIVKKLLHGQSEIKLYEFAKATGLEGETGARSQLQKMINVGLISELNNVGLEKKKQYELQDICFDFYKETIDRKEKNVIAIKSGENLDKDLRKYERSALFRKILRHVPNKKARVFLVKSVSSFTANILIAIDEAEKDGAGTCELIPSNQKDISYRENIHIRKIDDKFKIIFGKLGKKKKDKFSLDRLSGKRLLKGSPRCGLNDLNTFLISLFQIACDSAPDF